MCLCGLVIHWKGGTLKMCGVILNWYPKHVGKLRTYILWVTHLGLKGTTLSPSLPPIHPSIHSFIFLSSCGWGRGREHTLYKHWEVFSFWESTVISQILKNDLTHWKATFFSTPSSLLKVSKILNNFLSQNHQNTTADRQPGTFSEVFLVLSLASL